MLERLYYTGCGLDRSSRLRQDDAWLAASLESPRSHVLPLWRDHSAFTNTNPPEPLTLRGERASGIIRTADTVALLGVDSDGTAWFAADLSSCGEEQMAVLNGDAQLADLRRMSAVIDAGSASILAYARGLMFWHRRHRFCGVCGGATESREAGHMRVCLAAECGATHFPRTDPAVIMLVTRPGADGGACLLARQPRWPRGMYSTLAGFVEPGESLEEAVVREVEEETCVPVTNVRYRGSQPWPFPSSVMLGFRAEAPAGAEIDFDVRELEDAAWFTRQDISRFREVRRRMPRGDSIARRLVEEWIAEPPESGTVRG